MTRVSMRSDTDTDELSLVENVIPDVCEKMGDPSGGWGLKRSEEILVPTMGRNLKISPFGRDDTLPLPFVIPIISCLSFRA
jgi:hypothetical protein